MANKLSQSAKRLQINNANTVMIVALAVSSFVVVFSLVASKALLNQRAYQSRVITKKEAARDQLRKNVAATGPLIAAYKVFVGTSANILGGNPTGVGDKDGDNAKITLDALPSKYDFPALATSLDKLLSQNGLTVGGFSGIDEEISQSGQESSSTPVPVIMAFQASVSGNYGNIQNLISVFERSIRPISIDSINFSGSDKELQVSIAGKTYYQPEKDLTIRTEVVK